MWDVRPEDFDSNAGTGGDDYAALQAAHDSISGKGRIILGSPNGYRVSQPLIVNKSNITLEITSKVYRHVDGPHLISTHPTLPALSVEGVSAGGGHGDGYLASFCSEGVYYGRSTMGAPGSKTVSIVNAIGARFNYGGFSLGQTGLYAKNLNGLFISGVNASIGGDVAGDVSGILIDGTVQGSTGIVIDDLGFFGVDNPSGNVALYRDIATASGLGIGDRMIDNIRASGYLHHMIYCHDAGGFSKNVQFSRLVADALLSSAVTMISPDVAQHQECQINAGWVNMANTSGENTAFKFVRRNAPKVRGVDISNSGSSANVGIRSEGSQRGVVESVTFDGVPSARSVDLVNSGGVFSHEWNVSAVNIFGNHPVNLGSSNNSVLVGVNGKDTSLTLSPYHSGNRVYASRFGSIANGNPAGNVIA